MNLDYIAKYSVVKFLSRRQLAHVLESVSICVTEVKICSGHLMPKAEMEINRTECQMIFLEVLLANK
jgi:hypothetical protein